MGVLSCNRWPCTSRGACWLPMLAVLACDARFLDVYATPTADEHTGAPRPSVDESETGGGRGADADVGPSPSVPTPAPTVEEGESSQPTGPSVSSSPAPASNDGGSSQQSDSVMDTSGTGPSPAVSFLVDDFEDGNTQTAAATNNGWWYATNDLGGSQRVEVLPPIGDGNSSEFALRSVGYGFTRWGAILGVNLLDNGAVTGPPPSLAGQAALRFRAFSATSSGARATVMLIMDDGDRFQTEVEFPNAWDLVTLQLTQFEDDGRPFDFGAVTHVQFAWSAPAEFDVWFDDVSFVVADDL